MYFRAFGQHHYRRPHSSLGLTLLPVLLVLFVLFLSAVRRFYTQSVVLSFASPTPPPLPTCFSLPSFSTCIKPLAVVRPKLAPVPLPHPVRPYEPLYTQDTVTGRGATVPWRSPQQETEREKRIPSLFLAPPLSNSMTGAERNEEAEESNGRVYAGRRTLIVVASFSLP